MLLKGLTCRYGPIGVDLGLSEIKLVQVTRSSYRPAYRCIAMPRPAAAGDEEIAGLIKGMLHKGRFVGNKAICSLGNDDLRITSIRLADGQQVMSQVASGLGLDTSQYCIQSIHAGQVHQHGRSRQEVIVFAAMSQVIDARVRVLDKAGLEVFGLEPAACALVRGIYNATSHGHDAVATVDVGLGSSTVVIAQAGQVRLVKAIPIGMQMIYTQISQRLGVEQGRARTLYLDWQRSASGEGNDQMDRSIYSAVDDAVVGVTERLAGEVALCLRYYAVAFRGQRIDLILLAGGGAHNQRLGASIGTRCNCQVEVVCLPGLADDVAGGLGPKWLVAFGLASKGTARVTAGPKAGLSLQEA